MRRVAIVSTAQTLSRGDPTVTAPELVFDVVQRAVQGSGLARHEIGMTFSGSSDVLAGRSFDFVYALEAMGAHPPIRESHVEMDGAWAAFYAWAKVLSEEIDSALVVSWSKSSEASLRHVLNTQLEPFWLAPSGVDHVTSAALQADAWMRRSERTTADIDAVVERARASTNPALPAWPHDDGDGVVASPLHRRHCPVTADGACAVVLAVEDVARRICDRPAWIAGMDHRTESGSLGHRDLGRLASATRATQRARELAAWESEAAIDVAELCAPFAHQELMLAEALGVDAGTVVSPSGGALAADPIMTTGLVRVAECARQIAGVAGPHQVPRAARALAHAGAGHALQQNLVCLLEGDSPGAVP